MQIEIAKAVDFLYTKESTPITPPDKQNSDAGQVALSLVHSLPVGIIALDYDYNILAFNDNAPIYQTKKDCIIQLDFRNSSQSLEQWFSRSVVKQFLHRKRGLVSRMCRRAAGDPTHL